MAQWHEVGTINTTQNGNFRVHLKPEYVSQGEYSYDNLIELYNALGEFIEAQPTNDAGYPESLGLVVKEVKKGLDDSLAANRITEDQYNAALQRRRFEKYDLTLVVDD